MANNIADNFKPNETINKNQFSNLVETHQLSMYRLAKSILLNEYDAEDAVGSAIYKAYVSRNTIKDLNCFKAWILKIVSNESYSIIRKNKKLIYMEQVIEPAQISKDYESSYEVWDSVQKLEEKYRAIIVLFYYDDFSIKNISEILDIPQSTVKVRLFRARQKLKIELLTQGGLTNEQ
ncbi:MAG: sigma-70 family RNA polymerase sigma factor [Sedimentibacter sp.]|uniref:sigma-70 family RNA polymerase sigma factor n=1 Tax=Sedimentibacter sp. TaxID=1960295 RepID=UPI00315909D8